MRVMYDAVNVAALPEGGDLYLGYIDGTIPGLPNYAAMKARFPDKPVVSIAAFASTVGAQVYDVESGDLSPPQVPAVLGRERQAGRNPTFYVNGDNWQPCRDAVHAAGLVEPPWFLAHPAPSAVIVSGTVATQWRYAGGWDESAVADYWPGVDAVNVTPAIDPPFPVVGKVTAWQVYAVPGSAIITGARFLTDVGAVYCLGTAPFAGAPLGESWWGSRTAAAFDWPNPLEQQAGKVYVILATSGERYAFPV